MCLYQFSYFGMYQPSSSPINVQMVFDCSLLLNYVCWTFQDEVGSFLQWVLSAPHMGPMGGAASSKANGTASAAARRRTQGTLAENPRRVTLGRRRGRQVMAPPGKVLGSLGGLTFPATVPHFGPLTERCS